MYKEDLKSYEKLESSLPEHKFSTLRRSGINGVINETVFCEICRTKLYSRINPDNTISFLMENGAQIPDKCLNIEEIKNLILLGVYYDETSLLYSNIKNNMHEYHTDKKDLYTCILDIDK